MSAAYRQTGLEGRVAGVGMGASFRPRIALTGTVFPYEVTTN
jgi:hypothetical protein